MKSHQSPVTTLQWHTLGLVLLLLAVLVSCAPAVEQQEQAQGLSAAQVLGGGDTTGYLRATEARNFSFPRDHGPHDGYRNEWWYLTGNLEAANGRRFGYQVTFFSSAIRPEGDCAEDSNWCSSRIWMGHAAISDVANAEHHADEIFSRQNPGLAGAKLDPFRVWIQDWQLYSRDNAYPWQLEVLSEEFALTLTLAPQKRPVLQGDRGLSQKSAEPGNASYYYSLPRILTTGQVYIDGRSFDVGGSSWLDREWSTSALADDQAGWDWFSLQFEDGTELMYYQLRDLEGQAHPFSSGNLTSLMGTQTSLSPDEVILEELATWEAPDGTLYATEWHMQVGDRDLRISAAFEDQLMDVTFQYWEGAVEITDYETGEELGRGYLEMVH